LPPGLPPPPPPPGLLVPMRPEPPPPPPPPATIPLLPIRAPLNPAPAKPDSGHRLSRQPCLFDCSLCPCTQPSRRPRRATPATSGGGAPSIPWECWLEGSHTAVKIPSMARKSIISFSSLPNRIGSSMPAASSCSNPSATKLVRSPWGHGKPEAEGRLKSRANPSGKLLIDKSSTSLFSLFCRPECKLTSKSMVLSSVFETTPVMELIPVCPARSS
jgi:hypothetical protein